MPSAGARGSSSQDARIPAALLVSRETHSPDECGVQLRVDQANHFVGYRNPHSAQARDCKLQPVQVCGENTPLTRAARCPGRGGRGACTGHGRMPEWDKKAKMILPQPQDNVRKLSTPVCFNLNSVLILS